MNQIDWMQALGSVVPPDQAQINNAVLANGTPQSIAAPQGQNALPPQPPVPSPQNMLKQKVIRTPASVTQMSPAFRSYIDPSAAQSDQTPPSLRAMADQSVADQKEQLGQLNQYITDLANKPRGLNLTPIAAFIDSQTGSKLTPAAASLAPQSDEDREKMLFGLKNQMVQGQAKLSSEQLKSAMDQRNYELAAERQAELEKFHASEISNQNRKLDQVAQGASGGNPMANARLVISAQSHWDNNPILKQYIPRLDGAIKTQDLIDGAERGDFKSNQAMLGQLNAEIARLETGSQSPGLHASEKTEMESLSSQLGAIRDKVTSGVNAVDLGPQFNQARGMVRNLQNSYLSQIRAKQSEIMAGAADVQAPIFASKKQAFEDNYASRIKGLGAGTNNDGSPRGGPAGGSASSSSAVGPHGATVTQNGHTYTWNPTSGKYE